MNKTLKLIIIQSGFETLHWKWDPFLSRHFGNFHEDDNGRFLHTYTSTCGKSKLQKLDPSYLNRVSVKILSLRVYKLEPLLHRT